MVQQIVNGRIPAGEAFDECRAALADDPDEETAFEALFTLLRGALSDPFLGMDETEQVVPILAALTRREVRPGELL